MIALGPLVVAVIIAILYAATRTAQSARPPARGADAMLQRWVVAGLISVKQAEAIAEYEARTPSVVPKDDHVAQARRAPRGGDRTPRRIPAVAEALGYLGGILAVVGLGLVISRYWPDMGMPARVALSGGGAAALWIAGLMVRSEDDPALDRLRGFAWVASTACAAVFAGVVAADVFEAEAPKVIVSAASAAVMAESGLLWRRRRLPFQQLTLFGAGVVLAGSLVAQIADSGPTGIAVWLAGAVLMLIGVRRLAPVPAIGELVGGVAMAVGALMTVEAWDQPASLFAATTGGILLGLALVPGLTPDRGDHIRIGVIGMATSLQGVPASVGYFAQDAGVATGVVTWILASGLLYIGFRELVRVPVAVKALGAAGTLVGAAVTAAQAEDLAPIFGVVTAVGLVALGTLPGQALLSLVGSGGLLINVLWAINHYFPGEGRAPLLIMVAGALILAIAVLLTRTGALRRDRDGTQTRRSPPRSGASASGPTQRHVPQS